MKHNLNALKILPNEMVHDEIAVSDLFVGMQGNQQGTVRDCGFCEEDDTPPISPNQRALVDNFVTLDRQERERVMELVQFLLKQHPP